jgi:hypothetical protein
MTSKFAIKLSFARQISISHCLIDNGAKLLKEFISQVGSWNIFFLTRMHGGPRTHAKDFFTHRENGFGG